MCVSGFTTDPIFSSDPNTFYLGVSLSLKKKKKRKEKKKKEKKGATDTYSKCQSPGISYLAISFACRCRYPAF